MTDHDGRHGDELTLGENFERLFGKLREVDKSEKRMSSLFVPVGLFLIAQFGAGIWWAADISARLVVIEQKVELGTRDRYFSADADKDFRIRDKRIDLLQEQIDELDDEVERIREREIILEEKFSKWIEK